MRATPRSVFLLGFAAGLLFSVALSRMLPAPRIQSELREYRCKSGEAVGCSYCAGAGACQ